MTFIGSIAAPIKGEHLTADLVLLCYTPRQSRTANLFTHTAILAFCTVLLVFGLWLCRSPIINGRPRAGDFPPVDLCRPAHRHAAQHRVFRVQPDCQCDQPGDRRRTGAGKGGAS